jgi:hypothetical protein
MQSSESNYESLVCIRIVGACMHECVRIKKYRVSFFETLEENECRVHDTRRRS